LGLNIEPNRLGTVNMLAGTSKRRTAGGGHVVAVKRTSQDSDWTRKVRPNLVRPTANNVSVIPGEGP